MLLGYSVRCFPIRVSVIAGLDVRHIMLATVVNAYNLSVFPDHGLNIVESRISLIMRVRRCREAVASLFEWAVAVLAHCNVRHSLGRLLGRLLVRSVVRNFRICQVACHSFRPSVVHIRGSLLSFPYSGVDLHLKVNRPAKILFKIRPYDRLKLVKRLADAVHIASVRSANHKR